MANTYTVKSGDTLGAIASKHGVSLGDIVAINPQITDPDVIHVGDTITLPEEPALAEMGNGDNREGKCGNLFACVGEKAMAEYLQIIPNVNGKDVPKLELNQSFLFENTLEDSHIGAFRTEINGEELILVEDMSAFTPLQPKKPEDVRLIVGQCRVPSASVSQVAPLYPFAFRSIQDEMANMSGGNSEPWIKETFAQSQAQAGGADRTDILALEVEPSMPEGDYDLSLLDDIETIAKALTDAFYLDKPLAGSIVANTTGLVASMALLTNTEAKRLFWKQMLTKTKIRIVKKGGKQFMIFHGGTNLKEMVAASKAKALQQARVVALKILAEGIGKGDKNTVLKLEALAKAVDEKLLKIKQYKHIFANTGSAVGKGITKNNAYVTGKNTTKIALLEQFIGPESRSIAGQIKGNVVGIVLVVTLEGLKYFSQPESERVFTDFLAATGVSLVKFGIATAAGVLVASLAVAGTFGVAVASAPVVAIVGAALAVSFIVGMALDLIDTELGITEGVKKGLNRATSETDPNDTEIMNNYLLRRGVPTI